MKKQIKFLQSIPGVALITVLILMIPLIAMQFTTEVDWDAADFIIMGILISSTGASFVVATRYATDIVYKAAIGSAIGSIFLLIWVNLSVGLIGGGPNPGNMMYIGVVAVILIGIFFSRFTPRGMEFAMFATALALVLVAVIALLTNMDEYPGSSITEIIGVNAFFAMLFAVSGLLFRFVALEQSSKKSEG